MEYRALEVSKGLNEIQTNYVTKKFGELNVGEVLIKVHYSDINYKDRLAVKVNGGVIRDYPKVPGIDLAGEVMESQDKHFTKGDFVAATSYGIGINIDGGFSEYAVIPGDWMINLNELSTEESMRYGTSGFTAALSIDEQLKNGLIVDSQPYILITGVTGGVGMTTLLILAKLGFKNISVLVRNYDYREQLSQLGATNFISPEDLNLNGKLLAKQKFDYAFDTVGGDILANILPQVVYGGSVTSCGNAAGNQLNTTVLPFILRGIKLIGIDSVQVDIARRKEIWQHLETGWNVADKIPFKLIAFDEVENELKKLNKKSFEKIVIKI
ncbi:acrylyl-CoA reductase family protein [Pediococcus argentinicus]|uniref:Alcohol dehydrogenase n=1 Tax=Pediococcus argentinicus TaxID=480391 RepID=A0A0R2NIR9_9LACO|nr:acryloyl-CoA reductase [Pediococcus argentinicus]KRO25655.1 alcohol dehydrogenase [Pediococcus argentinicus]NKZ22007.1 acryloyl-CoA reductase [Pediococcus argentinicus]GEP19178.1 alcohol dehydrogenase [Pediococcus argentinicus]